MIELSSAEMVDLRSPYNQYMGMAQRIERSHSFVGSEEGGIHSVIAQRFSFMQLFY